MSKQPAYYENGVPVFIGENYFASGESVFIQLSKDNPDYVGVPHKHTFIEIVFIISGGATHITQKRSYHVEQGDLVIINFGTVHAFCPDEGGEAPFCAYDLMFMPGFFDVGDSPCDLYDMMTSSFLFYSLFQQQEANLGPDLRIDAAAFPEIQGIFKEIFREFTEREQGCLPLIRAYVVELLIKLFRRMNATARTTMSHKQESIVDATMRYLQENFDKQIRVDDLAARNCFSKEYFARTFKNYTGVSVTGMLKRIRLEQACALLSTTDRKIADIASCCGFGDIKFFYSAFKAQTGHTPGQYRSLHGKGDPWKPPEKWTE